MYSVKNQNQNPKLCTQYSNLDLVRFSKGILWVKNATSKAVQKVTLHLHLSQGKQVKLDQDQKEIRTEFPLISN